MKNKFFLTRRRLLQQLGLSATALSAGLAPHALSSGNNRKVGVALVGLGGYSSNQLAPALQLTQHCELRGIVTGSPEKDRKSTRLNSSHVAISYADFCLEKKILE